MQTQEIAKSLYHRDDPGTSREAAERLIRSGELSRQERFVFCAIQIHLSYRAQDNESDDFTAKEVVEDAEDTNRFAINYHLIQRRLSGLHRKGFIERLAEDGTVWKRGCGKKQMKRDGCAVWRLKNDND